MSISDNKLHVVYVSILKLHTNRSVGEEQCVVHLSHGLARRILQSELAQQRGQQNVQILFGKPIERGTGNEQLLTKHASYF